MERKIVLIGSNGQLGTDLAKILEEEKDLTTTSLTHTDIEITNPSSVQKALDLAKPNIVINTAAYNRVDEAETKFDEAFAVNAKGVKHLATYCSENNSILMHISTDYVFGADLERETPYSEDDLPGPINTYGISKLAGEYFVQSYAKKYFIVRTSGLFGVAGSSGKGGNFVETIVRLAKEKKYVRVVNDQILTPTYTQDLALQLTALLKTNYYGLYHATAEGECSWFQFAQEIFKLTKLDAKLESTTSAFYKTPARRPLYCVLENTRLKELGINKMPNWKHGLNEYLKKKGYFRAD